jgi:hypothetical protein
MRYMCMLIVVTTMVFVVTGSARGITSPGPLRLDNAAAVAKGLASLPVTKGDESLSKMILPGARNSTIGELFVAASAADGKGKGGDDKGKNPPPRSTSCPPDKGDQHNLDYRANDQNGGDNQGNDNKDKDQHDNCGKGDDGKNP